MSAASTNLLKAAVPRSKRPLIQGVRECSPILKPHHLPVTDSVQARLRQMSVRASCSSSGRSSMGRLCARPLLEWREERDE
jgi:hypothetical protein